MLSCSSTQHFAETGVGREGGRVRCLGPVSCRRRHRTILPQWFRRFPLLLSVGDPAWFLTVRAAPRNLGL
jgi:cytochrome P450